VKADFAELKLEGKQSVRDLWRQKDLGNFENAFEPEVPPHGVVLVKLTAQK
jgi:alpha-galactosidase